MIWGEAGVGKTTFCQKFCRDWALVVKKTEGKGQELTEEQKSELEKLTEEQRSKLNNIGLLIFILLRDIDEGVKNVKDIIIFQLVFHKEGTLMSQTGLKNQFLGILENVCEHRKLVLLMDGFDELSDKDENIEAVITGRSYQNIYCITTCKPYATCGIVPEVDAEIRLKGFSWAQSESFVKMYAAIKYTEQDQIQSFVKQTMHLIKSSPELCEISTNPSKLQHLCRLLDWKKSKAGKDRTSICKVYTRYLLMQYHVKLGKRVESYSDDLYKQNLLDAGKVALMGLKQNKLEFSEDEVRKTGRDAIFDIGFSVKLPSKDIQSMKVHFTHMALKEYLAAFYIVNTSFDEGLQLLKEFCSTSDKLMASKIILEFISNMSKELGIEIQKLIKDFVSKWDPKRRTSFLVSVLEETETFQFPLPAVIEIDFMHSFYKKSALERFFEMDGKGVRKISVALTKNKRLDVLQKASIYSLDELKIVSHWLSKTWSGEDNEALCGIMKKMKPGMLSVRDCDWKSMAKATISVTLKLVHTLILEDCDLEQEHLLSILRAEHYLKVLKVTDRGVKIDGELIESVSKLSSDIKLDISGKEITLIHKRATMKSLSICNCGIQIDTEIAEAVSRLPDHTELDLSGNQVTDKSACITLVHKARTMKSLNIHNCISNCGIKIDAEIAEAVSRLPDNTQLDLSGNQVTDKSACITLLHKALTMKFLNIYNCMSNCGMQIDTEIAETVSRLHDNIQLDLSGNQVTDKSACMTLIHKAATMRSLSLSNCGIQIDTEIAEAVFSLPDDNQLDLSGSKLTMLDPSLLNRVLLHMPEDKEIDITGWEIAIDVYIVKTLSKMPQLKSLKGSNNKLTPEAAREFSMSQLQELNLSKCGINETVCVSLMISLSKHCPLLEVLNLHGNKLTSDEWCNHVQIKQLRELYLSTCGIKDTVCVSLMNSLSKHCPLLVVLDLGDNNLSSSGVMESVDHIKHMNELRKLELFRNPCMEDEKCMEGGNEALELQKSMPWYIDF